MTSLRLDYVMELIFGITSITVHILDENYITAHKLDRIYLIAHKKVLFHVN